MIARVFFLLENAEDITTKNSLDLTWSSSVCINIKTSRSSKVTLYQDIPIHVSTTRTRENIAVLV